MKRVFTAVGLLIALLLVAGAYRRSASAVDSACLQFHAAHFADPRSAYVANSQPATFPGDITGRWIDVSARNAGGGANRGSLACATDRFGFDTEATQALLTQIAQHNAELQLLRDAAALLEEEIRKLTALEQQAMAGVTCFEQLILPRAAEEPFTLQALTKETCAPLLKDRLGVRDWRQCAPDQPKIHIANYCWFRFEVIPRVPTNRGELQSSLDKVRTELANSAKVYAPPTAQH
jgi:hypothetical protein